MTKLIGRYCSVVLTFLTALSLTFGVRELDVCKAESKYPLGVVNADGRHPGMVYIPAGEFTMGSNEGEEDEKPPHKVYVEGFWIDIHEVTNLEYERFDPNHERSVYSPGDNMPAVNVSWEDASAYARWAGKRLPTEAEWEKAAGGPEGYKYAYGEEPDSLMARTGLHFELGAGEVMSYPPNGYGLYDMSGNVWEWTADLYLPYPGSAYRDEYMDGSRRVLKGGSWYVHPFYTRVANRNYYPPEGRSVFYGFRCVE